MNCVARSYFPNELELSLNGDHTERVLYRNGLQLYTLFVTETLDTFRAYHMGQLSHFEKVVMRESLIKFVRKLIGKKLAVDLKK
jgi:hypothetical protein